MHLLISFIAFFAIISNDAVSRLLMVHAEVDVEVMPANGKNAHEHDASLTSDASFGDHYLHEISESDVENIPITNGNVSFDGRSGRLYNYDDYYMGSIDQYPYPQFPEQGTGGYDGEYSYEYIYFLILLKCIQ